MNIDNLESAITRIESVLENKDKYIGWQKKEIERLKGLIDDAFELGQRNPHLSKIILNKIKNKYYEQRRN